MNAKLSRDEMRHTYISVSLGYIYICMYFKISFVERFVEYFACRKIGTVEEQSFPINCLRFNVSNLSCRRNARIIVVVLVVVFEKKNCFKEIGASCQKILIRTRY